VKFLSGNLREACVTRPNVLPAGTECCLVLG